MSEHEPQPDRLQILRGEFEKARDGEKKGYTKAIEARAAAISGLDFFELGLKLGRSQSEGEDGLIEEIRGYLERRKQQINDQLWPKPNK